MAFIAVTLAATTVCVTPVSRPATRSAGSRARLAPSGRLPTVGTVATGAAAARVRPAAAPFVDITAVRAFSGLLSVAGPEAAAPAGTLVIPPAGVRAAGTTAAVAVATTVILTRPGSPRRTSPRPVVRPITCWSVLAPISTGSGRPAGLVAPLLARACTRTRAALARTPRLSSGGAPRAPAASATATSATGATGARPTASATATSATGATGATGTARASATTASATSAAWAR